MKINQRLVRTLVGIAVTVLYCVFLLDAPRPDLIQRFEQDLYDLRLKNSMPGGLDPRIVIIDIDEKSLAAEGRWPWNRSTLAKMVEQLTDHYQVALVGFDMSFSEPDDQVEFADLDAALKRHGQPLEVDALPALVDSINADRRFAAAIEGRPVVMGFVLDRTDDQLQVGDIGRPVAAADQLEIELPVPEATGYIGNLSLLQSASPWGGFFDNPLVDSDGTYRRVPILQRYQGHYYPSLALAMFLALFEETEVHPVIEYDSTGEFPALAAVTAAGVNFPVDGDGAVLVPYRGTMGSYPYISATDVIHGRVELEELEGVIALVGTSAAGMLDLRVTPVQSRYPGVEVHANIVAGMIDESMHHRPDYTLAVELTLLVLTGILLSVAVPRLSVLWGSFITAIWLSLVIGGNLYAWTEMRWVIPLGTSLILIVLLYLFHQVTGYLFETRNRQKLASQFGQYIPAEIVDELNAKGGDVELLGESREMTVFFSDIRGFTGLSELLTPQQLTRLMNVYLTYMTDIIYHHRGTVDKYIGDAVMAFWGAPLTDDLHPIRALDAAMEMDRIMPKINEELAAEGLPAVAVGMGLNTGVMNVGNMGSEYRMAYTVMGDAVNLGSRLEGLTKFYAVPIIVSGELAAHVPEYLFLELDRVQVKGRTEPAVLYNPVGRKEQVDAEENTQVERFNQAMELYRAQNWTQLQAELKALAELGFNSRLIELYEERLTVYQQHPPGDEWDGVYTHTSK